VIITRTPFRVSFFGGGTDYPDWFREYGGAVIATSIDKYCYLSVRHLPPFFEHRHRIVYSQVELTREIENIQHPAVRAILSEMDGGKGYEIHHDGDLPARSGLGSSSAFAVGLVHALNALQGKMVSKHYLASEAIRIEQEVLAENVGCQDQVTTAHGGFNRIDFRREGSIEIAPILMTSDRMIQLQNSIILVFTGLSRYASDIAGEQIRNFKKRTSELERMREMVEEASAILSGEANPIEAFGRLLHESWKLKRELASSVTTPRIDEIYDAARIAGAYGGKLLGAGGGGFMIFVVPEERKAAVRQSLSSLVHVNFRFETGGSKVIVYEPNGLENM
jgi:D-glycero-alpha-D-manno-heptose-7-phosphate kinase